MYRCWRILLTVGLVCYTAHANDYEAVATVIAGRMAETLRAGGPIWKSKNMPQILSFSVAFPITGYKWNVKNGNFLASLQSIVRPAGSKAKLDTVPLIYNYVELDFVVQMTNLTSVYNFDCVDSNSVVNGNYSTTAKFGNLSANVTVRIQSNFYGDCRSSDQIVNVAYDRSCFNDVVFSTEDFKRPGCTADSYSFDWEYLESFKNTFCDVFTGYLNTFLILATEVSVQGVNFCLQ